MSNYAQSILGQCMQGIVNDEKARIAKERARVIEIIEAQAKKK